MADIIEDCDEHGRVIIVHKDIRCSLCGACLITGEGLEPKLLVSDGKLFCRDTYECSNNIISENTEVLISQDLQIKGISFKNRGEEIISIENNGEHTR